MRADRLLSMLWELMAHERLTTTDLATRLEVSTRTVLRDVAALSAAGVPVYCERGRHGGVRLLPGFRTRVTGLTGEETRALFLMVTAPSADALGLGPALTSATRKLMAAVPGEHRPVAAEVSSRLVIDPEGWLPTRPAPPLEPLLDAALTGRRVRAVYRSRRSGRTWQDVVDPYGLLCAGGTWYLIAARDGQVLFLRADRLVATEVLDEASVRPAGLDLRALWLERRAAFRAVRDEPLVAQVLVEPGRVHDLAEASAGLTEEGCTEDGRRRVAVDFGSREHAHGVLHRFGSDVEVLQPDWLRNRLVDEARQVLERYRVDAGQTERDLGTCV